MTVLLTRKQWSRKKQAKHFRVRDEAKARRLEKAWKGKSKQKKSTVEADRQNGIARS